MRFLHTADREGLPEAPKILISAYICFHSLSGPDDNFTGCFFSIYMRTRTVFVN